MMPPSRAKHMSNSGAKRTRRGRRLSPAHRSNAGSACLRLLALSMIAALLTACASGGDSMLLLVDASKYQFLTCVQLAETTKKMSTRRQELEALIERAAQSPGGALVGAWRIRPSTPQLSRNCRCSPRRRTSRNATTRRRGAATPSSSDGFVLCWRRIEPHLAQAERVANDAQRRRCHGGGRNHRRQQGADQRIEHTCRDRDAGGQDGVL